VQYLAGEPGLKQRVPLKEAVTVAGPAGRLEVLVEEPREMGGNRVAVLCHPHPLHQGTMLNKVVHTLSRAVIDLGVPAIRFNFRGVGASSGRYARGIGETEDALAICGWATGRYRAGELWLGGFSFGAMVACRAALALNPGQLVTIAPPVASMDDVPGGRQPSCPWLIVQGDADEVVECDAVIDWVNRMEPGPELVVVPQVGHFFHGKLRVLRRILVEHLSGGMKTQ